MKDFVLTFSGVHEDLVKVIESSKSFVAELEGMGVTLETAIFSSGHLLGGSRDLADVHSKNPVNFADGTVHPLPEPAPEVPIEAPVESGEVTAND